MAVADLSHLAVGSLAMSSSMAGGNVISDRPKFGSPGSVSEQTADLPYTPLHNDPEPDLGPVKNQKAGTALTGSASYPLTDRTWKKVTPHG